MFYSLWRGCEHIVSVVDDAIVPHRLLRAAVPESKSSEEMAVSGIGGSSRTLVYLTDVDSAAREFVDTFFESVE